MYTGSSAHPEFAMTGPAYYILVGAFAIAAVAAAALLIHAATHGSCFGGLAHQLLWAAPQGLYLLALLGAFALRDGNLVVVAMLLLPVAFVLQFAYLLRIVFPKAPPSEV